MPKTEAEFKRKAECMIKLYSGFVEYGTPCDGEASVDENIADFGGVKFGFRAMREHMRAARAAGSRFAAPPPGLNDERLFYLSWGQTWCQKSTPETVKTQIEQDVHSPVRERVNGPLMSSPDFHEAFQCAEGTKMNPPKGQCQVW